MEEPGKTLGVVLFPGFELLDVFGPLEMLGYVPNLTIRILAETAGPVASTQGPAAVAEGDLAGAPAFEILFVPGGLGTRKLVEDEGFLHWVAERSRAAELVMSVCTGSGLLARAGVLDGKRATSNKRAFAWASEQGPRVHWVKEARWVWDGKFVTSSGVAAGMDMTLAVIESLSGSDFATALAERVEYEWQRDPTRDPFARIHRLVGPVGDEGNASE